MRTIHALFTAVAFFGGWGLLMWFWTSMVDGINQHRKKD